MLRNDLYKPWALKEDWGVEIIDGEFSGLVLQITDVQFDETAEGNLSVEYHVINKPEIITDEMLKEDLFKSTFNIIINDIVSEAVEIHKHDENRNNSSKEPDSQ